MKHRVVLGVIVTPTLGFASVYRNPLCAYAFARTVFEGQQQPEGLDITISLEQEKQQSIASGHIEIVGGTIAMMKAALVALKSASSPEVPDEKTVPSKKTKGSFIQLCIGSKEFAQAFVCFWAESIGPKSAFWESRLLDELSSAKPTDVIWIDLLKPRSEISHDNASKMMQRNIGSMVM